LRVDFAGGRLHVPVGFNSGLYRKWYESSKWYQKWYASKNHARLEPAGIEDFGPHREVATTGRRPDSAGQPERPHRLGQATVE
jgi:hypothetical protein